jgi:hypothetical protein
MSMIFTHFHWVSCTFTENDAMLNAVVEGWEDLDTGVAFDICIVSLA